MSMADSSRCKKKPKLQFPVEESSPPANFPEARPMEKRQQEQKSEIKNEIHDINKSISNINKIIDMINNEISELKDHIEVAENALADFDYLCLRKYNPFKFMKPIIDPRKSPDEQEDALRKHITRHMDISEDIYEGRIVHGKSLSNLYAERAALEYRLLEMERLLTKIQYPNYSGQAN